MNKGTTHFQLSKLGGLLPHEESVWCPKCGSATICFASLAATFPQLYLLGQTCQVCQIVHHHLHPGPQIPRLGSPVSKHLC